MLCSIITASAQLNSNWLVSPRFTNRGVKPMLTITDLYQSSLSFRRFSRNMSANTSLLFSLINHDLLYKCQSGFRANHSYETIFIKITDEWLAAMDKGLFTGVVMIDLRKAFDVVDRKLLLKKLQVYGLNTIYLKWFQSYLHGRYQKVCVDGKLSEPLGIHSGYCRGVFLVLLFFCSS